MNEVPLYEGIAWTACKRITHQTLRSAIPRDVGLFLGGVPREQKMLKGHLTRVIYHQIC